MIASINKGSNYQRLIEYHEKKCNEGYASLLYDGTFSLKQDVKEFSKAFDEHFVGFSKDKAVKNKIAHISLSLPLGEKLTDQKFIKLGQDYLNQMGYKNCPYLIYRHRDKDHEHIHLLVSTIDYNGKKISEFKDFERSQNISRQLETKHNLKGTEYQSRSKSQSLTEINFRRYYMHQAIKKASIGYNTKSFINNFLTDSEKKLLLSKKNHTQKDIFLLLGSERFNELYSYLQKKGYFATFFKDELSKKIDPILTQSTSFNDFVNECHNQGIYVRIMTDKNHRPYIKYGLIADNFYTKDINLSTRFRYEKLKEKFGPAENKSEKKFEILNLNNSNMDKTLFNENKEEKDETFSSSSNESQDKPRLQVPTIIDNKKKHDEDNPDLAWKAKKKKKGFSK